MRTPRLPNKTARRQGTATMPRARETRHSLSDPPEVRTLVTRRSDSKGPWAVLALRSATRCAGPGAASVNSSVVKTGLFFEDCQRPTGRVPLQPSHAETLIPSVMICGGAAFGRWLRRWSLEGGVLTVVLVPLDQSFRFPPCEGSARMEPSANQDNVPQGPDSAGTMTLDFTASRCLLPNPSPVRSSLL